MIFEDIFDKSQYYKKQYCELADLIICKCYKFHFYQKIRTRETIVIHLGF